MRQPKFKSWPAWHKRLQLAIHLEYARAPFFFSRGAATRPHRNLQAGNRDAEYVANGATRATDELAYLLAAQT